MGICKAAPLPNTWMAASAICCTALRPTCRRAGNMSGTGGLRRRILVSGCCVAALHYLPFTLSARQIRGRVGERTTAWSRAVDQDEWRWLQGLLDKRPPGHAASKKPAPRQEEEVGWTAGGLAGAGAAMNVVGAWGCVSGVSFFSFLISPYASRGASAGARCSHAKPPLRPSMEPAPISYPPLGSRGQHM